MKKILSLVLLITSILLPQQQTNWKNFANMKSVKDIITVNDGIWAATKGGAFFYNSLDSSYKTFSKAEGLLGIDLTAIAIDNSGKIWFGSSSGIIDVYDPAKEIFHTILDIYNSTQTSKAISEIIISGDTVFVATDFGVSLISSQNYFFFDTFFKFGTFTSYIKVNSIIKNNLIYLATNSGIAIQKAGATNLSAPESWNIYNNAQGLPNDTISSIIFYNSTLIAGTDNGLYSFNGTSWSTFLNLTNVKVLDLHFANGVLNILTKSKIYQYNGTALTEISTISEIPAKLSSSTNLGILVATNKGILANRILFFPNGPAANQFPQMVFDKTGNLWSSSGKDISGGGIYKYNNDFWEIFDVSKYPELSSNAFYSIFCSSDNSIYSGNWGQGFVKINENSIQRYHTDNTEMIHTWNLPNNTNFLVVSAISEDSKNNIWVLNLNAADSRSLYVFTTDSFYSFRNPLEQHALYDELKNLVVDGNQTKWYSMNSTGSSGLFYYNEKNTFENTSDDAFGYLSISKGLASNDIFSLAVDRRGDLWIGSNAGVNIISNVDALLNSSNPQFNISRSFPVRSEVVNAIAVDPLNQKWLGTNAGLFLLSSDGTQLLASVNTKNSPLLSDVIESLAFDESTGRLYIGTANGLTSFETPSINPVESFDGLNIYPNPLVINNDTKLVTIDGLIRDTDIKIFSVSGKLVREFSSPGGRVAFWDGRDDNGDFVHSGVYIVVAYDQEGNSVETGKIAVLRE